MTQHTIRIATRKSDLALWQANHVADLLRALPDVRSVELVPMVTKGDRILDVALNKVGGKGLFIKELEHAMLERTADIAVHSMKDVPAEMPEGFTIAAVLTRADPRDAVVGTTLEALPQGATVGTSSLRRSSQLKMLRPDLDIQPVRGNVNTRLAKLDAGDFDAILLACAGLQRLGMPERIAQALPVTTMLPAVGQGIVGIECLSERDELRALLGKLQSAKSADAIAAERAVALTLEATCHSPLGVHAVTDDDGQLALEALLTSTDGQTALRETIRGAASDGDALGQQIAQRMLDNGAAELIHQAV
ncbi:MAG: hydroxymethylbilane synthase [Pseudomonadota bacterium]